MKILTVRKSEKIIPCIIDNNGVLRDLSSLINKWNSDTLVIDEIDKLNIENFPIILGENFYVLRPFEPKQVISIGLNYRKHAEAAGLDIPPQPIISSKSIGAISGPFDDLILPPKATKVDWEIELAIVVGRFTHLLDSPESSQEYILGYCMANDYSDRDWLLNSGGEWIKGKSSPSFCPLGPFIVTKDCVDDVNSLTLICKVNGITQQNASTSDMIYDVNYIIYYVSQFMVLYPGDVILTGSPEGIGLGQVPPVFLKPDDIVESSISGLGIQRQYVKNKF